jgi:putative serine protease PepD
MTEEGPYRRVAPAEDFDRPEPPDPEGFRYTPLPDSPQEPRRSGGSRWLKIVAAVVAAPLLLGVGIGIGREIAPEGEPEPPVASQPLPSNASAPVSSLGDEPVAAVARKLAPSVVLIDTGVGLGSGVIYDSRGYILTAAHVVGEQTEVEIRLSNGATHQGDVLGADPFTDIAVVKIDAEKLQAAPLAVGEQHVVGQLAVAIGSPFGLEQTVTSGIISAVHRSVPANDGSTVRDMIQTDAPINPGNSGGALADAQGRVIGINDAIQSSNGGNQGVGFAVPIDVAAWVADKIVAGEEPVPAFLGVEGAEPTSGPAGALLTGIEERSPAAEAGLEDGDLVTQFDGEPIQSMTDLAARVRSSEPGTEVSLDVLRGGEHLEVKVTLDDLPS